jgi:predicted metal-dependent hydrolase
MDFHYKNLNQKLDKLLSKQQPKRKTEHTQFYPRTVYLTNVKFNHEELSLLNKNLQHNIEKPIGKYWTDLIMETELAIRKLDTKMQATYRKVASRKLNQIQASCNHHNTEAKDNLTY